jgi:hypothetical protein
MNMRLIALCMACLAVAACALGNHYGGEAGQIVVKASEPRNQAWLRPKYGTDSDDEIHLVKGMIPVQQQTYELFLSCNGERQSSPFLEIHVGDTPVHLTIYDCFATME